MYRTDSRALDGPNGFCFWCHLMILYQLYRPLWTPSHTHTLVLRILTHIIFSKVSLSTLIGLLDQLCWFGFAYCYHTRCDLGQILNNKIIKNWKKLRKKTQDKTRQKQNSKYNPGGGGGGGGGSNTSVVHMREKTDNAYNQEQGQVVQIYILCTTSYYSWMSYANA